MDGLVYLDNAATTRMGREVFDAMKPYCLEDYGNPASTSQFSAKARVAVENSRRTIAKAINAKAAQIYFTSGGTESNNWALQGVVQATKIATGHIITSKIEHHSVLNTCANLENAGWAVTYLDVDESGQVIIDDLIRAIRPETRLISIMHANNETGTIQDLEAIGKIAKEHDLVFHVDCVQTLGHIPIDVEAFQVDLASFSAHKLHGPKGVGGLYIKDPKLLKPLLAGGEQERKMRAGTVNVPGVVGFGVAVENAVVSLAANMAAITKLRDHFIKRIIGEIPGTKINGSTQQRLPNNVNIWFEGLDSQTMQVLLDGKNICCSSGSACASGSREPSHVLMALTNDIQRSQESLRFTLSGDNTIEQLDYVVDALKEVTTKLRSRT